MKIVDTRRIETKLRVHHRKSHRTSSKLRYRRQNQRKTKIFATVDLSRSLASYLTNVCRGRKMNQLVTLAKQPVFHSPIQSICRVPSPLPVYVFPSKLVCTPTVKTCSDIYSLKRNSPQNAYRTGSRTVLPLCAALQIPCFPVLDQRPHPWAEQPHFGRFRSFP